MGICFFFFSLDRISGTYSESYQSSHLPCWARQLTVVDRYTEELRIKLFQNSNRQIPVKKISAQFYEDYRLISVFWSPAVPVVHNHIYADILIEPITILTLFQLFNDVLVFCNLTLSLAWLERCSESDDHGLCLLKAVYN